MPHREQGELQTVPKIKIKRTPKACRLYLTPVFQPGIPPRHKKYETNPISVPLAFRRLSHAQICETNPKRKIARRRRASTYITPRFHRRGTPACPYPSPKSKKYQTNPIPPSRPTQKMRNEPNSRTPSVHPPLFPQNEPNFACLTPRRPLFMRNEPNPSTFRISPRSVGMQFYETNPIGPHRHLACPTPKNTKQTQSRTAGVSPAFPCPIMRNKPKKKNRPPQACIHLYNPPVPPAGYPSLSRSIGKNQKIRNKPNSPKPTANRQMPTAIMRNEPNPIHPPHVCSLLPRAPIIQNKPNLPHAHHPPTQKYETNPI